MIFPKNINIKTVEGPLSQVSQADQEELENARQEVQRIGRFTRWVLSLFYYLVPTFSQQDKFSCMKVTLRADRRW